MLVESTTVKEMGGKTTESCPVRVYDAFQPSNLVHVTKLPTLRAKTVNKLIVS